MNYAHNSYVVYSGPSQLDGAPIVMIATGFKSPSENPKTGPMIQTWILRRDVSPDVAGKDGRDESVCGQCPLRTKVIDSKPHRACYVRLHEAPSSVYRKFMRGEYPYVTDPKALALLFAGQKVRLGSYGDPAAVPFGVLSAILAQATNHTAYTHQWKTCDPRLRHIAMASVESQDEQSHATSAGWRTFRILRPQEPMNGGEILCPASEEAGKRTTCAKCSLCNGTHGNDHRKSVGIHPHGIGRNFVFTQQP